jgi:rhodanese-related sulfurtransferase
MKNILISLVVVVAIGAGLVYTALNNSSQIDKKYDVSLSQIENNIKSKEALLVDVRTPDEFAAGHAQNAINLPLLDIQNGKVPGTMKDNIVYVYCRSGKRASNAKLILEQKGYKHVISIISLDKWVAMGGDVVKSETTCNNDNGKC